MSRFPTAWQTLLDSRSPKFLVKGHALARTLYGPNSRFCVYEVRALGADGYPATAYRVHDAHRITDAEVRAGKSAPAIAHGLDWSGVENLVSELCGGADADPS